jgi:hypothetical protein
MYNSHEDSEATETTDTNVAPVDVEVDDSAAAEEPVEAAEVAEPVEAAAEETPEESIPEVFDWNGEVNGLKDSDWFNGLEDNLKQSLLKGFETKYNNWQRGYTDKFSEMSQTRKKLDMREKDVREQEARVQRWLNGDVDPMVEKQKEIDELKVKHQATLDTLRQEYADTTEKASTASQSELQEIIKEREELRQQFQQIEDAKVQAEKVELDNAVEEFETWVKTSAPEIYENTKAFDALCALCIAEIDPHKALNMVKSEYSPTPPPAEPAPAPEPEPEPEPVPDSMDMMNMGSGSSGTEAGEHRSLEDIMDQMRRAAQLDATTVMGVKG